MGDHGRIFWSHTAAADENFVASVLRLLNITRYLVIGSTVAECGDKTFRGDGECNKTHMTGPMKLVKSEQGPILSFATSVRSCSLNPLLHTLDETYRRESAEHFCPTSAKRSTIGLFNNVMMVLTLVLERAADSLIDCIPNLRRGMNEMEILAACYCWV